MFSRALPQFASLEKKTMSFEDRSAAYTRVCEQRTTENHGFIPREVELRTRLRVQPSKKSFGFTLIELLIALSIAAILFMWVLPVKQDFFLKNKISTRTEEIVSALHYARSQASLLGQSLILAPKEGVWSSGMILFIDQDSNHAYGSLDKLLFQWQWQDNDLTLSWSGLYDNYLLFTPTELNSVLGGTFYLCPVDPAIGVRGKHILMNRLGRIRVEEAGETCHT